MFDYAKKIELFGKEKTSSTSFCKLLEQLYPCSVGYYPQGWSGVEPYALSRQKQIPIFDTTQRFNATAPIMVLALAPP